MKVEGRWQASPLPSAPGEPCGVRVGAMLAIALEHLPLVFYISTMGTLHNNGPGSPIRWKAAQK
jgi:hypothetical protein